MLTIRDGEELWKLLEGHTVLAGFCGHLHKNFIENKGNVPVIHTGALSGSWWGGPDPDGTPKVSAWYTSKARASAVRTPASRGTIRCI